MRATIAPVPAAGVGSRVVADLARAGPTKQPMPREGSRAAAMRRVTVRPGVDRGL